MLTPYAVQLTQPFDAVDTSADGVCLQLGLYLKEGPFFRIYKLILISQDVS